MLNGIWGFFLIGGILTGAFLGRMDMVTGAILSGGRSAVELAFAMAGVISVWSGVLKIAERGGMIDRLAARLTPLMDFLFPSVPRLHPARKYIATNFVANFLGLGWAATPAGLMAMKELQRLNREERGAGIGGNVHVSDGEHDLPAAGYDEYSGVPHGIRLAESGGDYRSGDCGNDAYDIGWYACGEGIGGEGIAWGYC